MTFSRLTWAALLTCTACGVGSTYRPYTAPSSYSPSYGSGGGVGASPSGFGGGSSSFCGGTIEYEAPSTATPPPISGGSMAVMADGRLVIGDVDRDVVWLVAGHGDVVRRVSLTPGDEPGRVVEGPSGTAFVVLRRANQIARINVTTGEMTRLETCSLPRALIYRAASDTLLVGCAAGTIAKHVGPNRTEVETNVSDLRDLVEEPDRVLATSFRAAKVFTVDVDTGQTTELPFTGAADGEPRVAWRTTGTPFGTMMAYQTERTTTLPPLATVTCAYYASSTPSLPSVVVPSVAQISPTGAALVSLRPKAVLPVDLAVNAHAQLAVVAAGQNAIDFSNDTSLDAGTQSMVPLAGQPTAVVARGDEWVVFERQPVAIAFIDRVSHALIEVPLPGVSVASTGHELFHRATDANIACASCHPEAGDDEHIWPFAEGSRRTPTLRGGLARTAPFHWSGDELNMASLVGDVMVNRMAGKGQTGARAEALMAWLDVQKEMPAPPTDSQRVARGAALFASTQTACTTCHSGELGTNNLTVDVGTEGQFQVPRLVELGWRTHWLHDGRVATPGERFEVQGGSAHGVTAQLSAQERLDLIEYLKSR